MTQTTALFIDAYRELNHKKLFWITLGLSGLIVAVYAMIGINDRGIMFLKWTVENPINTKLVSKEDFYKLTFVGTGVKFWLTWGAMILALISTASIFPDFLAGGAIELSLSKPISRLRLFLTKYAAALTFVGFQVGAFTFASFLVIGIRGGAWEPGLFLAVPLVLLVFSFIYSICVLAGVLTRSTIAALLIALCAWFVISTVNWIDVAVLQIHSASQVRIENREQTIERMEKQLAALPASDADKSEPSSEDESTSQSPSERDRLAERVQTLRDDVADSKKNLGTVDLIYRITFALKTVLPKNAESTELMNRWLVSEANMQKFANIGKKDDNEIIDAPTRNELRGERRSGPQSTPFERAVGREAGHRVQEILRKRTTAWVLGTSLGFELVMLSIAAWLFCRRDF